MLQYPPMPALLPAHAITQLRFQLGPTGVEQVVAHVPKAGRTQALCWTADHLRMHLGELNGSASHGALILPRAASHSLHNLAISIARLPIHAGVYPCRVF